MRRLTAAAMLGLGCASPGMPPGGPPDAAAPQIVKITPDSGAVGIAPKEVLFRFDEVVSERPAGSTTLSDLFLISPREGIPDVSWHREAIGVRPSRGWRPNTPYTVIMLRGIADLRGNVRNTGASTFFSTGKTLPRTRLTGRVFDWVAGTPANGALVESFVRPDTLRAYIALADSTGAFAIEHLPPARYTVRAYVDRNKNLGIDPSEPWDSVSVDLRDSVTTPLLLFTHDSAPPRIREIVEGDSASLRVSFDRPIDPSLTLSPANFAVIGPDSAPVPILSAAAAPGDTTRRAMPRPPPVSEAIIRLRRPLAPKTTYRVRAMRLRGLLGHTGDSDRPYTTPAPPPPPAAKPVVPATVPAPVKR